MVLNNNLDRLGPGWSLSNLTPSYSLPCTHNLIHYIYVYLPVRTSWLSILGIIYLDAFQVPRESSHSLAIDILSFNPDTQTLPLLPPNQ